MQKFYKEQSAYNDQCMNIRKIKSKHYIRISRNKSFKCWNINGKRNSCSRSSRHFARRLSSCLWIVLLLLSLFIGILRQTLYFFTNRKLLIKYPCVRSVARQEDQQWLHTRFRSCCKSCDNKKTHANTFLQEQHYPYLYLCLVATFHSCGRISQHPLPTHTHAYVKQPL